MTLKIVQIRQWFIIDKFMINHYQMQKNDRNSIASLRQVTNQIIQVCSSIESYNQFWSPILTVDFIGYSLSSCYLIYCLFFKQSTTLEKYFFTVFLIFGLTFLVYFIRECVKVTRNNAMIKYKYRNYFLRILWSCKTNTYLNIKVSLSSYKYLYKHFNVFFLYFHEV